MLKLLGQNVLELSQGMEDQHDLRPEYQYIKDYLPSLKFLVQSILELSAAQGIGDQHDLRPYIAFVNDTALSNNLTNYLTRP